MDHEMSMLISIAAAVSFGMLAQVLAHRWRFPAIVLLLAFGLLLGESALGIVRPSELSAGLGILVKLAVAIILFEGALNLNLKALRESVTEIRNLVTFGVLISWGVITLIARFIAGFDWQMALLFGALMTVTGPTVIQPLLRRVTISRQIKTILEGEAILIDPIGAILAIAVFDILLAANTHNSVGIFELIWVYFGRLIIGSLVGGFGAFILSRVMKAGHLIPMELSNLVALAFVWGSFGLAEWLLGEAGIMAAVMMGLVVQREAIPGERHLKRFKESLTTLGISILFILLAAKLNIGSLLNEGLTGLLAVFAIMFVARPLTVLLATWRSKLDWRKKLFIAWIGPRGIIAASVASIFSVALEETGLPGGDRLLALTFLTILVTVVVQGLSAGWVARRLGLQSMEGQRAIIVGANRLSLKIADLLQKNGRPTQLVDTNRSSVEEAKKIGLTAVYGNALEEFTLESLHAEEAATVLAMTSNSEVNVLACQLAHDTFGIERAFPLLTNPTKGANPRLLQQTGGKLAFGRFVSLVDWEAKDCLWTELAWSVPESWPPIPLSRIPFPGDLLPVIRKRGNSTEIVHADQVWQPGDTVITLSSRTMTDALTEMEQVAPPA